MRLATRGSPLALAQAALVATALQARAPGLVVEKVVVRTEGDRRVDVEIERIAGQGVFVKEVQAAVLEGRADITVHSAKDLPPRTPPGLVLVAVPERADPRDALVGATLDGLRPGAVVATGSARRRAQIADLRPDLGFVGLRGNMATRLARATEGAVAAVVVASAALDRLGWGSEIAERLSVSSCLPQVGQGALALECRDDDEAVRSLLQSVDDPVAHRAVAAERAFLAALGAGCSLPVAGWAEPATSPARVAPTVTSRVTSTVTSTVRAPTLRAPVTQGGVRLRLHGLLASGDGRIIVRGRLDGDDPAAVGEELARHLVHDLAGLSIDGWVPPADLARTVR